MTGKQALCSQYNTAARKPHAKHLRSMELKFHCSQNLANLTFPNGFKISFTKKHIQVHIDETVTKQINQRNWDK